MTALLAKDLMTAAVGSVGPRLPLSELERALAQLRVSGLPVVDEQGELVGVVSRFDVIRAVSGAEAEAESMLAYYREVAGAEPPAGEASRMAGERAAALRVEDVMVKDLLTVRPDQPAREVAGVLARHRVHRVLVVDGRRLLGLISALDIARAVAEGML